MRAKHAARAVAVVAGTAWASPGATQGAGLLAWAFLGLCAVGIAGQVVPAAVMLASLVRGALGLGAGAEETGRAV